MNKLTWRPEDARLLLSLREAAGIDAMVFARVNTVSVAQLKELEQGEGNSFYNPQIKRSTGIKLLKKLGHEPATACEDSQPEEPAAAATATAEPLNSRSANWTTSESSLQAAPLKRNLGFSPKQVLVAVSFLGIVAVILTGNPWAQSNAIQAVPTPPPLASLAPTLPSASETTGPSAQQAFMPSPPTELSAPPKPSTEEVATQTPASPCDAKMREVGATHTTTAPLKPGNYVYFEAIEDTELCVRDHDNQVTWVRLPAGMKKTVHGSAPFLVQTSQWNKMKMFFQGRQVPINPNAPSHLVLNNQDF
jgi:hypothetical protein